MLRTHRSGKGPGGCGGWGLGSRNRRDPGVPPTPGLRGQGTSPGRPAGFLGSSGQGSHPLLLSHSSWMAPPACLSWSPWPPSYAPQDPRSLEGLWRAGDQPGSSAGSLSPSGRGSRPPLLSRCSWRVPPACLSLSPWPQRCRSCLASTSPPRSVPLHPTGSLWSSSRLLGRQSPPPAASGHPSCVETLTLHLPTLPYWLRLLGSNT